MGERTHASPLRVLIVEDSADTRESTALLLRLWGCDAKAAADGPAALALAVAYMPDVILLDVGLPGMDGLEVARRLRALTWLRQPLLVSLSGYAAEADHQRALEAGCDIAWSKPADPADLRRLVGARKPDDMRELMDSHRAVPAACS